jgi:hypothetical protein
VLTSLESHILCQGNKLIRLTPLKNTRSTLDNTAIKIYLYDKQERQCKHNVTLRRVRANHCCRGKTISITHSESVFAALVIRHTVRMRHIVIRGLPGFTIFFHIIS